MHLIDRGLQEEEGLRSKYAEIILTYTQSLESEQVAIMALICEQRALIGSPPSTIWLRKFAHNVSNAQDLMPSGIIKSRQVLATLAILSDKR